MLVLSLVKEETIYYLADQRDNYQRVKSKKVQIRRAKLNKLQVKTVPLNKHPSFPAPSSSSNSSFLNNSSSSSSFLTLPRNTRKNGGPVVPTYDGTGSKEISIRTPGIVWKK